MRKSNRLTMCTLIAFTLLAWGCLQGTNPTGPEDSSTQKLFIFQSDFTSGILQWMDVDTNLISPDVDTNLISSDYVSVYKDAVLDTYDGYVYILERFGADNVLKFDPAYSDESGVLYQTHIGDNYNPQDIAFISATKAYISNQNKPEISIFNPEQGTISGSIDLTSFTLNPESNISPHANKLAVSGTTLYVMLQRRDGWAPGAPTLIVPIDTETDEIVVSDTISCTYKNGYDMVLVDGNLYVTNPGSTFSTEDGAIEKINLATKEVTTVIDEATLGGNPNQIVHISGSLFYVQNYIGLENVAVVQIDASNGSVVETLPEIKDAFGGIAFDPQSEMLFVGERGSASVGVRVFKDNKQIAGPFKNNNTLPPSSLTLVK